MLTSLRIQFRNACTRSTLTRVHFCFVLVAFIHCISLVFLQAISFAVNSEGRHLMIHVMETAGARRDLLAVVATRPTALYMCESVPSDGLTAEDFDDMRRMCTRVSPRLSDLASNSSSTTGSNSVQEPANPTTEPPEEDSGEDDDEDSDDEEDDDDEDSDSDSDDEDEEEEVDVVPPRVKRFLYPNDMTLSPDVSDSLAGVTVVGLDTTGGIRKQNGDLFISSTCATALRYPEQMLQDMERENVSFVFFHVWLLIISIIAITQESIPHIVSALAGQLLSSAFSTWDIFRTLTFRSRLDELVSDALCAGADLLPNYWHLRTTFNVSIACINLAALAITSLLSVKLIKLYLTAHFGVTRCTKIEKLYRVLLAFSTLLRLYVFFVVLTAALWIDQIAGGLMHTFLTRAMYDGYLGMCTVALIFALPLVVLGDMSMRTERRGLATGFLVMQALFLVFHIALLASSSIFRWTLIVWPFFALNVGASFLLAVAVFVMGIVCRLNFGRGLEHYLLVTDLLEKTGFTPALIPAETMSSRLVTPSGKFDALLEHGDTIKINVSDTSPRVSQQPPPSRGWGTSAGASDTTANASVRGSRSFVSRWNAATKRADDPADTDTHLPVPPPPLVSRWSDVTKSVEQSSRGSWDSRFARVMQRDSGFESASSIEEARPGPSAGRTYI